MMLQCLKIHNLPSNNHEIFINLGMELITKTPEFPASNSTGQRDP